MRLWFNERDFSEQQKLAESVQLCLRSPFSPISRCAWIGRFSSNKRTAYTFRLPLLQTLQSANSRVRKHKTECQRLSERILGRQGGRWGPGSCGRGWGELWGGGGGGVYFPSLAGCPLRPPATGLNIPRSLTSSRSGSIEHLLPLHLWRSSQH